MKNISFIIINLLAFTLLNACSNEVKPLERFDNQIWKADKNGCKGNRATLYNAILTQQKQLQNHSQEEISAYFGMPDKNELMERGQKQFIYFFENGPTCKTVNGQSKAIYLRFSALNNLYEISVQ
ncbi:MAG: hypothetical protein RL711_1833 [Bacteroidota bacterium]|jgi:hypothetical protein